uniref:7-dehydrocholesterol reductase n=3 Tax=Hemiselmis andersenii TaxID=464988 RepID=A0A7S1H106_HEMAN|mmetsp:Transcript_29164/g.71491  ORF Transcript_29164/g.71491 Transcript_29164/m.71491 type:complete len:510 (+) Transcript_29164:49-1578(+)
MPPKSPASRGRSPSPAKRGGRGKSPGAPKTPRGRNPAKSPARSKSPAPRASSSPAPRAQPKVAAAVKSWSMSKANSSVWDLSGAIALMVGPAVFTIVYTYALLELDGSAEKLLSATMKDFPSILWRHHPSVKDMMEAMKVVVIFWIVQLAMMPLVPGKIHTGPVAPSGHRPKYKANGVATYLLTVVLFFSGAHFGFYKAGVFYDIAAPMYAALNYFSIVFCAFLYYKGLHFPSTKDSGSTGSFVFDYFWGTELYPRVGKKFWSLGWDLKQFTNCRWGMMFWAIGTLSFMMKQREIHGVFYDSMFISVFVQQVYVFKFFLWETGYLNTMDIQHDRAGFYICWGCLVWVPCLYTCHTLFLVHNPIHMGEVTAAVMGAVGVVAVYINWDADQQKITFRENDGNVEIWGKKAVKIQAVYRTDLGINKPSLLLASGWWGVSRHFHYLPELMAAFCWSAPTLWSGNVLGFAYWVFLLCLLTHRSFRDEERCSTKYGTYWDEYKKLVPYRIVPYLF